MPAETARHKASVFGLVFGLAFDFGLGVSLDMLAVGLALGVPIGLGLGRLFWPRRRKQVGLAAGGLPSAGLASNRLQAQDWWPRRDSNPHSRIGDDNPASAARRRPGKR